MNTTRIVLDVASLAVVGGCSSAPATPTAAPVETRDACIERVVAKADPKNAALASWMRGFSLNWICRVKPVSA